jgi:hypothetical protein
LEAGKAVDEALVRSLPGERRFQAQAVVPRQHGVDGLPQDRQRGLERERVPEESSQQVVAHG